MFPWPPPFVGCTRLDRRPIAPADAHQHLADAGHEHAGLGFVGEGIPAVDVHPVSRRRLRLIDSLGHDIC